MMCRPLAAEGVAIIHSQGARGHGSDGRRLRAAEAREARETGYGSESGLVSLRNHGRARDESGWTELDFPFPSEVVSVDF